MINIFANELLKVFFSRKLKIRIYFISVTKGQKVRKSEKTLKFFQDEETQSR